MLSVTLTIHPVSTLTLAPAVRELERSPDFHAPRMKPTIQLYESVGTGIILNYPSGIMFTNQTGGTSCLHPEIEGIYVPIRNDFMEPSGPLLSPTVDLRQYFEGLKHGGAGATRGLDSEDADFIDSLLGRVQLGTSISVDRTRLVESHEAWVHVIVSGDESGDRNLSIFSGFTPYPRQGILTWCNSD